MFQNLIHNAVKFNDKALPTVEVGWRPHRGDTYLFYVRDNGPGIEADYLEIIFKIFEKLDSKTEGTGAGLAICRRIVEEHGGGSGRSPRWGWEPPSTSPSPACR